MDNKQIKYKLKTKATTKQIKISFKINKLKI